jgi:hypothetical protein
MTIPKKMLSVGIRGVGLVPLYEIRQQGSRPVAEVSFSKPTEYFRVPL